MKKQKKTNKRTRQSFVAYYRVSTQKQSLGLDAQKTMVRNYLKNYWPPDASFTEKESGKSDKNRPELQKALEYCKKHGSKLVVATLSRLSRDLHFITMLDKQKIDFVICNMPKADPLTKHIMGAIAQYERETISKRTSRALQELKNKGVKLGSHNPKVMKGLKKLWAKRRKLKKEAEKIEKIKPVKIKEKKVSKRELFDEKVVQTIRVLREDGKSYREIAKKLNASEVPTRFGGKCLWHTTTVQRIAHRNNL